MRHNNLLEAEKILSDYLFAGTDTIGVSHSVKKRICAILAKKIELRTKMRGPGRVHGL
jgi:hypothetical protein